MIYKNLELINKKVSLIGLGTGTFGGKVETNYEEGEDLTNIIKLAYENGINFFDTAETYGNGYCEELIGNALRNKRKNIVIATKFKPSNSSAKNITKSVDSSLKRLKTDYIDIYQSHWPNYSIPIESTLEGFERVVKEGKVLSVGFGNVTLSYLKKVTKIAEQKLPIISIQNEYSLFERSIENKIMDYCNLKRIEIIAYSPLGSGKYLKKIRNSNLIKKLEKKYNLTSIQILLQWLVVVGNVLPIPMTKNKLHLNSNAEFFKYSVEKNDLDLISNEFKITQKKILPKSIMVRNSYSGLFYKNKDEALKNRFGFSPSPSELSKELIADEMEMLKPIKVKRVKEENGLYNLYEGQLRFWAWVIAFGSEEPILATIDE